jgi:hypothetical protein
MPPASPFRGGGGAAIKGGAGTWMSQILRPARGNAPDPAPGDVNASFRSARCVFSIHNLALQGVRPFEGSPRRWRPGIRAWRCPAMKSQIGAGRTALTPWRRGHQAGGRRAHGFTHLCRGNSPCERPAALLRRRRTRIRLEAARSQGRLFGILNGRNYPADRLAAHPELQGALQPAERNGPRLGGAHSAGSPASWRTAGWPTAALCRIRLPWC